MARPKVKEAKRQYTAMLKPSTVKEIDKIADKIGLTRSQLIFSYIAYAVEQFNKQEKLKKKIIKGGDRN